MLPKKFIVECEIGSSQQDEVMNHHRNVKYCPDPYKDFKNWDYVVVGYPSSEGLNIFTNISSIPNYQEYKVYTYAQWKQEIEIPKKWCIKPSSSRAEQLEIRNWINSKRSIEFEGAYGEYEDDDDDDEYYWHYPSYSTVGDYCWTSKKPDYTEITFEQFEQYILKEKQTIMLKENFGILAENSEDRLFIKKWCETRKLSHNLSFTASSTKGYYFTKNGQNLHFEWEAPSGIKIYTVKEIQSMETGEIIGYKAPTDLWKGDIKKGELFIKVNDFNYTPEKENNESLYIPKEIVETWEKCYEKEEVKLTIGSNNTEIIVTNVFTFRDKETATIEQLVSARRHFVSIFKISSYSVKIPINSQCILIGCENENNRVSLEELSTLINTYNKVNGTNY